jgi:nucleotide-binding universal stress UspA family protein
MLNDILINVPANRENSPAVTSGLVLAKAFGAHATGLAVGFEPVMPVALYTVPGEILVDLRNDAERAAIDAARQFMKSAQDMSVVSEAIPLVTGIDGGLAAFARLTRVHDLTVVDQPNPDRPGPEIEFLETALFASGRAVLVVPYVQKAPLQLGRILVAWDGGRAATRALSEARPLLARAKQVEVIVVATSKQDETAMPGVDIARHLARHNLKVEVRRVQASSAAEVDETILNAITEDGIDLVVMGGYGHSRLREFVLGGVTRSIIESMTAPVLMAH